MTVRSVRAKSEIGWWQSLYHPSKKGKNKKKAKKKAVVKEGRHARDGHEGPRAAIDSRLIIADEHQQGSAPRADVYAAIARQICN